MAWLQEDADAIRAAIVALVTGARVASVSYAGPPARTVTYSAVDLSALRALLSEMDRSWAGTARFRLVSFTKGFGGTGTGGTGNGNGTP